MYPQNHNKGTYTVTMMPPHTRSTLKSITGTLTQGIKVSPISSEGQHHRNTGTSRITPDELEDSKVMANPPLRMSTMLEIATKTINGRQLLILIPPNESQRNIEELREHPNHQDITEAPRFQHVQKIVDEGERTKISWIVRIGGTIVSPKNPINLSPVLMPANNKKANVPSKQQQANVPSKHRSGINGTSAPSKWRSQLENTALRKNIHRQIARKGLPVIDECHNQLTPQVKRSVLQTRFRISQRETDELHQSLEQTGTISTDTNKVKSTTAMPQVPGIIQLLTNRSSTSSSRHSSGEIQVIDDCRIQLHGNRSPENPTSSDHVSTNTLTTSK